MIPDSKKELEKELGTLFFENIKVALRSFSPEIIPLLQQENELTTESQGYWHMPKFKFNGNRIESLPHNNLSPGFRQNLQKKAWKKCASLL